MKKIAVLMVIFLLFSFITVSAQSSIGVAIDGEGVVFNSAAPFIDENNRTLVPLRAIGEAMGLTVNWDNNQREASFAREYSWENSPLYHDFGNDGENDEYLGLESVSFKIDDNIAIHDVKWYVKGTSPKENGCSSGGFGEISMDTAAIIKDSSTYAPIKYLAEAFRYDVDWDNETRTVLLNYMYSVYELGIQVEMVACWKDHQGWIFTVDEVSDIQSVDILNVAIDTEYSEYSILTEEEQSEIYEIDEGLGKYLNGFTVEKEVKTNTYHDYKVTFLVTMKDGTQKLGFADISIYFDGMGGYI